MGRLRMKVVRFCGFLVAVLGRLLMAQRLVAQTEQEAWALVQARLLLLLAVASTPRSGQE